MFVKQTLNISQHINFSVTSFELLFIEISNNKKRSALRCVLLHIIGVIYRLSNTDLSLNNNKFENVITFLTKTKTNLILARDYNINLLNHEIHLETGKKFNILFANTMV